ncbi:hypothetical protein [Candidatus Parabeggiatoa sp. HSG14]|uniref:hypothetical protein n=1 Tax=Candidatus Parabeggiatoa sp. HSG14 TaxID=3055593 RepID=UPI0025A78B2B|nr:hypothetical protein [Thiotrichales bacterium HSG14]
MIVDIQHVRFPDHYHRFLHYHCAALLDQVVYSKDYRPGLKIFTLVILTSKHSSWVYILQTFKFSDYENILKTPAKSTRF